MSCYQPLLGVPDYDVVNESGKRPIKILGRWQPFVEPDFSMDGSNIKLSVSPFPGSVSVPCGKCLGCRLDYSRQWADRMMLEFEKTHKAIFLTLTYNEEHVPCVYDDFGSIIWYTLNKQHWQDFMKRLRSRKEFDNRELKFYMCGEYGSKTLRPHMHAIIFGISVEDFPNRRSIGMNELRQIYYTDPYLEDLWKDQRDGLSLGFITFSAVSWQTCAYVSRYTMKKLYTDYSRIDMLSESLPEFSLMSRRPGIGSWYFYEKRPDPERPSIYLNTGYESQEIRFPKYFMKLLEKDDPLLYSKIKEQRREFALDKAFQKMLNTDLSYIEILEKEEMLKSDALKKLKERL